MARRREPVEPLTPGVRPFTDGEVTEVRRLIAGWSHVSGHPHPYVGLLERIHAAAGRRRGFKAWELDPIRTPLDLERAVDEELSP